MNFPLISVIVPIYKAEKYIRPCLASVARSQVNVLLHDSNLPAQTRCLHKNELKKYFKLFVSSFLRPPLKNISKRGILLAEEILWYIICTVLEILFGKKDQ